METQFQLVQIGESGSNESKQSCICSTCKHSPNQRKLSHVDQRLNWYTGQGGQVEIHHTKSQLGQVRKVAKRNKRVPSQVGLDMSIKHKIRLHDNG